MKAKALSKALAVTPAKAEADALGDIVVIVEAKTLAAILACLSHRRTLRQIARHWALWEPRHWTLTFTLAESVAEELVHTLPDTLTDVEAETFRDTQGDVLAAELLKGMADTLAEEKAAILLDTLGT